MVSDKSQRERGFIGRIILLIVAVVALKYFFNFDVVAWFKSLAVQSALQPVFSVFVQIYHWLDHVVRNLVNTDKLSTTIINQ